jgi:aspartate/methionine/tyrosine aminotransferase
LIPVLEAKGYRIAASEATMYLWVKVDEPAEELASRLLDHGLVISPGTFFGPSGEGYVRFALVPTEEECRRAAAILEEAL